MTPIARRKLAIRAMRRRAAETRAAKDRAAFDTRAIWDIGTRDSAAYRALAAAFGDRCRICRAHGRLGRRRRLYIDYDTDRLFIRGLLCKRCLNGIRSFRESTVLLHVARKYLQDSLPKVFRPVEPSPTTKMPTTNVSLDACVQEASNRYNVTFTPAPPQPVLDKEATPIGCGS